MKIFCRNFEAKVISTRILYLFKDFPRINLNRAFLTIHIEVCWRSFQESFGKKVDLFHNIFPQTIQEISLEVNETVTVVESSLSLVVNL